MIKIAKIIKDKSGQKKAVVIPYRQYESLVENLHDLAVVAERKREPKISHAEIKKRLKSDGLL